MCGRFNIDPTPTKMRAILDALGPQASLIKTGDIYPGDVAPVLALATEGMEARAMSWGFPRWDGRGVVFNARAETALVKPMFRKALRACPVVVPTTGF
ncbi:SOS response-associated peptidase family protein, partial [uncultured Bilophila sp.]